jgi:hypothetical protein
MKIEEAATTFDSVRRMAPGDPRGYFFGSMVHFWLYTLTRDEKEYRTFLDKSDDVITVCENLLDANDKDAVSLFYLGGMYGYRGLAHQAHNSIFKAVTEGRKGYFSLKEAVQLKPDLYDAQMGFGLFTYLVAKVPKSLSWILSVVGFSGDAEGPSISIGRADMRPLLVSPLLMRKPASKFFTSPRSASSPMN